MARSWLDSIWMQWVTRSELSTLGFPPADEALIRLLRSERSVDN
jgi:hypothetical protein